MGQVGVRKAPLSRRELEVAALVAEGLTNRAIADRMFISERTVEGHLEHIREKLGVSNRAQVASWFAAGSGAAGDSALKRRVSRRRNRPRNLFLLPAAVVAVVALVAGAVLYEQRTQGSQASPAITTFASVDPGDELSRARAVAVGPDGSVYIGDYNNERILRVDPKQGSIATFAGGGTGDFVEGADRLKAVVGFVNGLAFGPDGSLYFTRIQMVGKINPDGTVHQVLTATDRIKSLVGLAFGPDGTLYLADGVGNQIWERSSGADITLFAGTGEEGYGGDGGPAVSAELDRPRSLVVEANGDVLISDTENNRIRRVAHGSGKIDTVAGSGDYYGFSGDGGLASQARLSIPWGITEGRDGKLYIADAGNDRVRVVNSAGIITTLVHGDFSAPAGLALSSSGDLFVVELGGSWLRMVHPRP